MKTFLQISLRLLLIGLAMAGLANRINSAHAKLLQKNSPSRPAAICISPPTYADISWRKIPSDSPWVSLALQTPWCARNQSSYLVYIGSDRLSHKIDISNIEKQTVRPHTFATFSVPFRNGAASFRVEVVLRGANAGMLRVDWQQSARNGVDFFRPDDSSNILIPPDGSYIDSCDDIGKQGDVLIASCDDGSGHWEEAKLKYPSSCTDDISNLFGRLVCTNRKFPPGSYQRVCADISIEDGQLNAVCFDDSSGWHKVSRPLWDNCQYGMTYQAHGLVCERASQIRITPTNIPDLVPTLDCKTGIAQVVTPSGGETVSGVINVMGSADCNGLGYYKFEIENCGHTVCFLAGPRGCNANNLECDRRFGFVDAVHNDVLMRWDTRSISNGRYTIRLSVVGYNGAVYPQFARFEVVVQN